MNWKKIIGLILALAVIAAMVIRLKNNKETTQNKIYTYDKEKPVAVEVDTLYKQNVEDDISFTGYFEPYRESKISAESQGKINSILVDAGSYVKKGQTLIQLDNSLLKLQLQSVNIQIEGLENDIKRYTVLSEADAIQGIQLEKAELGLKSALVQKATLEEQLSKTTVKAPFEGVITAKLNEVGGFAAPGAPLLQLTDIAQLKFTIHVPEKELVHFKQKQTLEISNDVFPEITLRGEIIMVGSKAHAGNSFPIQFLVRNTPDLKIKSGMFGKTTLRSDDTSSAFVIPASAIVGTATQPQVYLVKDGKAILQNVSVSKRFDNKAVVSEGVNEGELIITKGFINVYDEATVFIQ
jgi:RND family efflux transporter MFP subunit